MRRSSGPLAALAMLLPAASVAGEQACFISYEAFEEKIPHLDIGICPSHQVAPEEGFCRIALQGQAVLIYLFRHGEAGPCLAQVDRYTVNEFVAPFGTTYTRP
ncbi:hypothetical protein [Crenalkalicoccus roseus]|uniref:hypothetical protein n=1 Tax=Crenalkalicoccus roseus TaxID=1485588 RepID=UPI001081663F|nr:hypothetical protein [Crenalkalicoccus roseus]